MGGKERKRGKGRKKREKGGREGGRGMGEKEREERERRRERRGEGERGGGMHVQGTEDDQTLSIVYRVSSTWQSLLFVLCVHL